MNYQEIARKIRIHVLNMTHRSKSSHIGSGFSAVELLAVLYFGVLRVDPKRPDWPDRDRFIMSKGHAAAAVYATLAERGFFPLERLETFCRNGTTLMGHVSHEGVPGIEAATGSLGHGLGIAAGMALMARRENRPFRVFAMLSDGECDEGSTWEAAMFAGHHRLDNLISIVDYNKIQSLGHVKDVLDLEPFADKWRSFNWHVREIDGHNIVEIEKAFRDIPFAPGRPSCILAHTVKGKGVSFMEDKLLWHYRSADGDEYRKALEELGG